MDKKKKVLTLLYSMKSRIDHIILKYGDINYETSTDFGLDIRVLTTELNLIIKEM